MLRIVWIFLVLAGRTLCDNDRLQLATQELKSPVENCTGSPDSEAAARRPGSGVGTAVNINFGPLPKNRNYLSTLGSPSTLNPYYHVKEVLHVIHPSPFPLDLLRESLKENDPNGPAVLRVIELEVGFLSILFLSILLSMVIPGMVLSLCTKQPEPPPSCAPDCKRKTLVFILQILLALLLLGSVGMLWSNEECSRGMASSPAFVGEVINDSKDFLEDSVNKLQYLLTEAFDQAAVLAIKDLNDAENLLGEPIQVELVLETRLDAALDSLSAIAAGAKEVCAQVAGIIRSSVEAEQLVSVAKTKFDELRIQLESVKRRCKGRDRPLCDSIPSRLLEVKFTTKMIANSSQLEYLKQAGVDSLAAAVTEAHAVFTGLPSKIEKETKSARQAVTSELLNKKSELATSSVTFDQIKSRSKMKLLDLRATVVPYFESLTQLEYWRWVAGLIAGLLVVYVWVLLVGATCCGCCGAERSSTPTLIVALVVVSLGSVSLWFLSFITLYIGGHGENHVCRLLKDPETSPEGGQSALSSVVDALGAAYDGDEETRSYVADLVVQNHTVPLPFETVLRECKASNTTYNTFHFSTVTDIEKAVNVNRWTNICNHLQGVHVNLAQMQIFGPKLNARLEELRQGLMINVSHIRAQMAGPTTSDLDALANHLNGIAKELSDVTTSAFLDGIAVKTRKTLETVVEDLENHKENLVYHLTALELKISPLLHKLNQSITHMKAVQFYVNNHGMSLAHQNANMYITRIKNYLDQYQNFVLNSINNGSTTCRPVWEMFSSLREQLCRQTLDPLNGFWFMTIYCLLVLIIITPVCLKLINYYNSNSEESGISASDSFITGEMLGWSARPPPPQTNNDW
uniref:Prominin-1 n=2 Tax=Lygus hesperus TaxID=30085 RepID=A0A0A9Y3P7_LYGHE